MSVLAISLASPALWPRGISVLLLMLLAALAASLTWQVLAPDVRPGVTLHIQAEPAGPSTAGPAESPLAEVAQLPLFGVLNERVAAAPVVAPETRLRLRLVGLSAGGNPNAGHAIITEDNRRERLYTVGDAIGSGQARVHQIHADRVILERDNAFETLRLPRADGGAVTAGARAQAPGNTAPRDYESDTYPMDSGSTDAYPTDSDSMAGLASDPGEPHVRRVDWLSDPDRLMQSIRARPVIQNGMLHGLEVRPTRNARQFQQAGLQPGDVITSVNGMPVASIDNTDSLLQELSTQSQVDLVVERNGQAIPLSVQLLD